MFALFILLFGLQTRDPGDAESAVGPLVQQLRSDNPEERDEAARKLKDLGKAAVPFLERAATDRDVEVSGRAKRVLEGIRVRARLTPGLIRGMPGIEDRLAFAPIAKWTEVFKEAVSEVDGKRVYRTLKREDLESLAGPAVRGSREGELRDLNELFEAIGERGLRSAIPELALLVRDKAEGSVWAIDALRELRAAEAAPLLLSMMADSSSSHHAETLGALQAIETRDVARELRRILPLRISDRLQILEALVYLHAGDALPEMLKVLGDDDAEVRSGAAFLLGKLNLPGSVEGLTALLEDRNIKVRESAARGLAMMRVRAALPVLLTLVANESREVREQACCGLGDLGAPEGLLPIRRLLRDPEPGVRGMAAYTLTQLADPKAVPDLLEALKDPEEQVRAWSVSALRRSRALGAAKDIRELLKDPSHFVREMSVRALADFGVREAVPDIAKLLDDVGIYGVHALRDLDARECSGDIARLVGLPGGDGQVRRAAGQALGAMNARAEIPAIKKLLSDPDYGIRRDAALALSEFGDRGTIPAIRPLLEDDHPDVREAAVQSLERLGDEGSDRALADLLSDPFKRVRIAAAESFCRRGKREGVPAMLRDAWDLTALNAVRAPEAWKRLSGPSKSRISVEGSVRTILSRVESESGLKIEWPERDGQIATWLGVHEWSTNSASPLEVFRDVSWNGRYAFLLGRDSLRVVLREDAIGFWSDWWKSARNDDR